MQYKDAKVGAGRAASEGDRVVFDWDGYTIGEKQNSGRKWDQQWAIVLPYQV